MEDFFTAIDKKGSHNAKIILLYNYKLYRSSVELIKTRLLKSKDSIGSVNPVTGKIVHNEN